MAQRMIVQRLTRLTLVRKGKAVAKHPDLRKGVVEKVAATDSEPSENDAVRLQRRGQWQ